jgi:hypothetical protein
VSSSPQNPPHLHVEYEKVKGVTSGASTPTVKAASAVICGDSSWIETQVLGMRGRLLALQGQSLTNTNFMQGPQLPVYIKSGGNYVKSVLLLTPLV